MRNNKRHRRFFALLIAFGALASLTGAEKPGSEARATQTARADAAGVYNVRAFGAKGDGVKLDTPAINKTINAAAAAGGGTVRFPAGTYL